MNAAAHEPRFIYMTAGDREEASKIAETLVGERLLACANVLDGMRSFYWWDGEVQSDDEAVMIAKTEAGKVDAVVGRIKELHSYDCPCVVALPIDGGNPEYLEWIAANVGPEE